jgi:hypothetical protein
MGRRAMATVAPSVAHLRGGPHRSSTSPETGALRYGSPFALLERDVIQVALAVQNEQADLRALMWRYRNRPMSLADACLVRLSEIHAAAEVLTFDSDFRIYRRHGNKVIPLRTPM